MQRTSAARTSASANKTCAICLNELDFKNEDIVPFHPNAPRNKKHFFHRDCLRAWNPDSCPVCRQRRAYTTDNPVPALPQTLPSDTTLDLDMIDFTQFSIIDRLRIFDRFLTEMGIGRNRNGDLFFPPNAPRDLRHQVEQMSDRLFAQPAIRNLRRSGVRSGARDGIRGGRRGRSGVKSGRRRRQ